MSLRAKRSNLLVVGDWFAKEQLAVTRGTGDCFVGTNAHHNVLYTGVTNDLQRRVLEHREGKTAFTKKYNVTKLVFFECGDDINIATPALQRTQCGASVAREKQIKGGSRKKKIDLISSSNPEWKDLFEEYFGGDVTAN